MHEHEWQIDQRGHYYCGECNHDIGLDEMLEMYTLEQLRVALLAKQLVIAHKRIKGLEESGNDMVELLKRVREMLYIPMQESTPTIHWQYEDYLWYQDLATVLDSGDWQAALGGDEQPCGHPASAVVSSDEGTNYCGMCERGDE